MTTITDPEAVPSAEEFVSGNGGVLPHWKDGAPFPGASDRSAPVYDPATGRVTKQVALASRADADAVIASAAAAFPAWRDLSLARRTAILFRFRELLNARKHEAAEIITSEHGKVLSDALGEITRGQEIVELACGLSHLLKGSLTENASTRVDVSSIRQPLGVVGIISPFNFPAMVPMWFFPVAIAAGNTVVLKPSEKDPTTANWLADLWKEAGLPDGVFNVLHGDKTAVDALLESPDVKAISFVGSTPIAQYVYATGTGHGKRVQALGGAKNHMLVLPDADLDLAADAAVNAGFGSAGERCMAISALVAVDSIADELIGKITERMATLRTGDGRRGCDMGPLVTGAHRDKVAGYVQAGVDAGAELVVDGRAGNPGQHFDGAPDGFWLAPTLFDRVTPEMSIYTDEIFGPVLSVVRVDSYDQGLDLINRNPYGNGTAIFTNDGGAARRFQNEVQVGMIGINVPIPVPVAYYSFGGWKDSLFGDTHAHGTEGVHFFTRGKVVTSRWLDPSHGGLNLGFPQNN
jgi:malonate-semialdehyde dehydrogenase (acetylating) / methylmalonate-semialdehyde dehydrogenase